MSSSSSSLRSCRTTPTLSLTSASPSSSLYSHGDGGASTVSEASYSHRSRCNGEGEDDDGTYERSEYVKPQSSIFEKKMRCVRRRLLDNLFIENVHSYVLMTLPVSPKSGGSENKAELSSNDTREQASGTCGRRSNDAYQTSAKTASSRTTGNSDDDNDDVKEDRDGNGSELFARLLRRLIVHTNKRLSDCAGWDSVGVRCAIMACEYVRRASDIVGRDSHRILFGTAFVLAFKVNEDDKLDMEFFARQCQCSVPMLIEMEKRLCAILNWRLAMSNWQYQYIRRQLLPDRLYAETE